MLQRLSCKIYFHLLCLETFFQCLLLIYFSKLSKVSTVQNTTFVRFTITCYDFNSPKLTNQLNLSDQHMKQPSVNKISALFANVYDVTLFTEKGSSAWLWVDWHLSWQESGLVEWMAAWLFCDWFLPLGLGPFALLFAHASLARCLESLQWHSGYLF